ncbi:MAG: DUF2798 domain-containing protein [Clostridium baratii]|uniref:Putative membrane protein n=1 Tax=Clostridium baratii str. Sullivan TaxID=1415775 RepID=A0A0A7FVZ7_9CLOT|nr:DUF2798 domain-containing protein [Clostridium baratii]AIY83021.1 putative membrane protein [Clostridium baratii str. Sullivan]MBS6007956.1 DUF2798 domain-containing protein [Clostridium baratii]MDU1055129.1 DUF2798 domain-containing protein [Clostridium baratii]MDU4912655.1 DUF2798 domain-containing protein [Clostridium baratii]
MPTTKKESLIFTIMMCAFMVFCMSVYNVSLHSGGFSKQVIIDSLIGFPLTFIVAMVCDWFIVSRPAKAIAFRFIKEEDKQIKIAILISLFMVCGMVLCMSMFGALHNVGLTSDLPLAYITAIGMNFIVALPLQLLIAGPIVRFIFGKVFNK